MPTITFTLTDEDVERIAKRLAAKLAEALKQVVAASATPADQPKPPPDASAEWLTLGDVQRMFRVSRSTVYRWTHEQGMPVRVKAGRYAGRISIRVLNCLNWRRSEEGTAVAQPDPQPLRASGSNPRGSFIFRQSGGLPEGRAGDRLIARTKEGSSWLRLETTACSVFRLSLSLF